MAMQYNLTDYLSTSELGKKYGNSNRNNVSNVPNADRLNFRLGLGPLARAAAVMAVVKNPESENPMVIPDSDIGLYPPPFLALYDRTSHKAEPYSDDKSRIIRETVLSTNREYNVHTYTNTQQNRKSRTDYKSYMNPYHNPYMEEDSKSECSRRNRTTLFYSGNPDSKISRKLRQGYSRKSYEARFRRKTGKKIIEFPGTADLETRVQELAA